MARRRALMLLVGFMAAGLAPVAPAQSALTLEPVSSVIGLPPYSVAVAGGYAYCAAHELEGFDNSSYRPTLSSLTVYDISDPARTRQVGALRFDRVIADIAAVGNYAYVYFQDSLRVIDVSDPTVPVEVNSQPVPVVYPEGKLCVSGGLLYLTLGASGFTIFDLSDPASPVARGSFTGPVVSMAVSGHRVYVSTTFDYEYFGTVPGIMVLDVSDPDHPTQVARWATGIEWGFTPECLAATDSYLLATTGDLYHGRSIAVLEVSSLSAPSLLTIAQIASEPDSIRQLELSGSVAYLVCSRLGSGLWGAGLYSSRLVAVDLSDPAAPVTASQLFTGVTAELAREGDTLVSASHAFGLRVFDATDPLAPVEVAKLEAPAFTHSLEISEGLLLGVTWYPSAATLMDIGDPVAPDVISTVSGGLDVFGMSAVASRGYLYSGSVGVSGQLTIHDISQPAQPLWVYPSTSWYHKGPTECRAMALQGSVLYVSGIPSIGAGGLVALDVADPTRPQELGRCATPGASDGLAITSVHDRAYAYIGNGFWGLVVIDVSDPRRPAPLPALDTPGWASKVVVAGGYLYLDDGDTLRIYSIDFPGAPQEVAIWTTDNLEIGDIKVIGSYLYLADANFGFRVLGLSDPRNPVEVKQCSLPDLGWGWALEHHTGPSGIAAWGGYIYVADYGHGIYVVRLEDTFADVDIDSWATDAIERCVGAAVVGGYDDGTYRPAEVVTRDQMAVFISRASAGGDDSIPPGPATPRYPDVPPDYWAYRYIEYAASRNIVQGYPSGDYRPEETVTRAQMSVFIARSVCEPTGEEGLVNYTPPAIPTFSDVNTDYWAYKYVEYVKENNIAGGYGNGTYRPDVPCTRDQMAVYVTRAFQLPT